MSKGLKEVEMAGGFGGAGGSLAQLIGFDPLLTGAWLLTLVMYARRADKA